MTVAYYEPFHGYNVFFNIARPKMFTRSIPVGEYKDCSFKRLCEILNEFHQKYHFTIKFKGFTKDQLHQLYEERLIWSKWIFTMMPKPMKSPINFSNTIIMTGVSKNGVASFSRNTPQN